MGIPSILGGIFLLRRWVKGEASKGFPAAATHVPATIEYRSNSDGEQWAVVPRTTIQKTEDAF